MGFSQDNYAKIKEVVEQADNYTVCKCTISKKNKVTKTTELQFSGFVKFLGNAHKQRPMEGQRIKITACDVTNCYVKDGTVCYNKNPIYLIFGYELQENYESQNGNHEKPELFELDNIDGDIPF